ncbi:MAG: hypothetical protein WAL41_06445 [Mycobacterium sp.]
MGSEDEVAVVRRWDIPFSWTWGSVRSIGLWIIYGTVAICFLGGLAATGSETKSQAGNPIVSGLVITAVFSACFTPVVLVACVKVHRQYVTIQPDILNIKGWQWLKESHPVREMQSVTIVPGIRSVMRMAKGGKTVDCLFIEVRGENWTSRSMIGDKRTDVLEQMKVVAAEIAKSAEVRFIEPGKIYGLGMH